MPAWYRKEYVTFADPIASMCRCLWNHGHLVMSTSEFDALKILRSLFESFTDALCYAA
jgi:hypothetical protein